jgi:signal transduction histidine kinase/ligand-binding sensor domain-containing protein
MSEVTSLYQDYTGFIWFGSSNGLYRYDGKETIVFRHDVKNKNSIPSSNIWQLSEDSHHRLWVSTQNGVAWLDSARKVFTTIFPQKDNADHQRKPYTNAILADSNDQLWFSSVFGLHHFNPKTGEQKIFRIHDFTPYVPNHRATGVIREDGEYLWIATTTGICRFSKTNQTWKYFLHETSDIEQLPLHNTIQDLLIENDTLMWVSCWGGGIKRFNPAKGTFQTWLYDRHVPRHQWGSKNVVRNIVTTITGNKKKYWVGTLDRTFAQFDPAKGEFHFVNTGNSKGYDGTAVTGSWYAANLLWVATTEKLYKINLEQPKLRAVNFDHLSKRPKEQIAQFASDPERGRVYFYTHYDNKLFYWDYTRNETGSLPLTIKTPIDHICILPDGKLLIAAEKELYVCDYSGNTFKHIHMDYDDVQNLSAFKKGTYLIATFTDGLRQWNEGEDKLEPFLTASGVSLTEKYPALYAVLIARDQKIWLATRHDGLVCYDPVSETVKTYTTTPDGISIPIFYSMKEDSEGKIWACSLKGLICIDNGAIIRHYTTSDGLPADATFKILIQEKSIWITTIRGLACLNRTNNKIEVYAQQDGLEKYNLSLSDIELIDSGRVVIGEAGRMLVLDPLKEESKHTAPKAVITSLRVMGEEKEMTKETILQYEQNQVTFEFVVLDYAKPELNQYAYKLEGADHNWNYTGNTNSASYASLAPGRYTFRVKGTDHSGSWSDDFLFTFSIMRPFWQTLWFRSLVIIFMLSLLYAAYRYRVAQLIRLQRIRNGIASDLHDDIGSALTSISLFSEAAKKHSLPGGLHIIDQMGTTSRKVLDDMNDIVWAISPKNDAFKNLFERMRLLGNQLFGAAQIEFKIEADVELTEGRLSMSHRRNLYLIYKEALTNIIKYADATCVQVSIRRTGKSAVLLISDNGKGFDTGNAASGNGLENMKLRARQINGLITIQSALGAGTSIRLHFKSTTNGRWNAEFK